MLVELGTSSEHVCIVQAVQQTQFGCITVVAAELAKRRVQCRLDLPCKSDSAMS